MRIKLHPTTWWIAGLALAIASSAATNPWVLLIFCGISISLTIIFGTEKSGNVPRGLLSFRFYLIFASLILLTRLLFRVIFNSSQAVNDVALRLPAFQVSLGFGGTINILGDVSTRAIYAGFSDGLRLAAIILAFAMAATLSSPRKLIKSLPLALYELGTAVAISLNLAPQLISSVSRVRRSRSVRGRSTNSTKLFDFVIPVLEDALEKSMSLAASMDARGFGRRVSVSAKSSMRSKLFSVLALLFASLGAFFLLLAVLPDYIAIACFVLAATFTYVSVRTASIGNHRTQFRKPSRNLTDFAILVFACCLSVIAIAGAWR